MNTPAVTKIAPSEPEKYFGLNLDAAIRATWERTHLSDPGKLAEALLADLPPEHLRDILRVTLRNSVRVWWSRERMNNRQDARQERSNGNGGGTPNRRYDGLLERILNETICVATEWKAFGKCSADDLAVLARDRHACAARTLAVATSYERLRHEMEHRHAKRVMDLPRSVLRAHVAERGES